MVRGSCMCGTYVYELDEEPTETVRVIPQHIKSNPLHPTSLTQQRPQALCYCQSCQKAFGNNGAVLIHVPSDKVCNPRVHRSRSHRCFNECKMIMELQLTPYTFVFCAVATYSRHDTRMAPQRRLRQGRHLYLLRRVSDDLVLGMRSSPRLVSV